MLLIGKKKEKKHCVNVRHSVDPSVCTPRNFVAQKTFLLISSFTLDAQESYFLRSLEALHRNTLHVVNGHLLKTTDAVIFLLRTHLQICLRGQRRRFAAEIFNSHFSSRCQSADHISACFLHHLLTINQHPSYTQWKQINFHDKCCVSTHLSLPCYLMI